MKKILLLLVVPFLFFDVNGQEVKVNAIPYKLHFENQPLDFEVLGDNHIQITAPKKTDLFVSQNGKFKRNNSPKLLFKPDSDFILTSKITPDFASNLDGGVLLIYNDSTHYAKFCFEKDYQGQPRVISVVCNEVNDGCKSMAINDNNIYFRIAGSTQNNIFSFYCSEDSKSWFFVRFFRLNKSDNIRIGFNAQSPIGDGCKVEFSEIQLEQRKVRNFRKGD